MKMLIFLALLIASACAQTTTEEPLESDFELLDTNKDNEIELDELYAYFDKFDTNDDGEVSEQEYAVDEGETEATLDPEKKALYDYFDELGGAKDGEVLRTEVPIMMTRLDTDGNGKISLQEFEEEWGKVEVLIEAEVAGQAPVGK